MNHDSDENWFNWKPLPSINTSFVSIARLQRGFTSFRDTFQPWVSVEDITYSPSKGDKCPKNVIAALAYLLRYDRSLLVSHRTFFKQLQRTLNQLQDLIFLISGLGRGTALSEWGILTRKGNDLRVASMEDCRKNTLKTKKITLHPKIWPKIKQNIF